MVFLLHVAMPEHPASCSLIPTEVMDGMGLFAGGTPRLAINGQMTMIGFPLGSQQATGFLSTARLSFPAQKKCRQDLVKALGVNGR